MSNDTKQKLIEKGAELILLKSYNGVGLKEILDETGIPKGSFYNYFPSKETFCIAIIEYYSKQYSDEISHFLSDSSMSPRTRMRKYFANKKVLHKKGGCSNGCFIANMTTELSSAGPEIAAALKESFDAQISLFSACIREGQAAGEIAKGNADDLAEFIFNSWEGAIIRMQSRKDIKSIEAFEHFIFMHILPEKI